MLKTSEEKIYDVLLVEDNRADARIVTELLKEAKGCKFHLAYAETLSAAVEIIGRQSYDIILLDLSLPDGLGLETFKTLNRHAPHLPIIVFTGLHDEDMAIKAVREGAQDYLVKGETDGGLLARAIRYAIERKRLEDWLIQSRKMEAVGQMASGIVHDFRNVLMVIKGNAEILQHQLAESPFCTSTEKILASTEKAVNLIQGLLALGRKQTMSPKVEDLNDIISKFERFLLILLGKNGVELSLKLAEKNLRILGDRSQIEQVLMNLAINAKDAMPEGGRLEIESDYLDSADDSMDGQGLIHPGRFAVISVSDNGQGIDSKLLNRIFEPFFTTKAEGNGTGLGLSMVYGIVRQHNGYVHCSSIPGTGTTFRIYLPLTE